MSAFPGLTEADTILAAVSERVRNTGRRKDMPCCEHMASRAGRIKHSAPQSFLLPLLWHLGLPVRDTVCQPVHALASMPCSHANPKHPPFHRNLGKPSIPVHHEQRRQKGACRVTWHLPTGLNAKKALTSTCRWSLLEWYVSAETNDRQGKNWQWRRVWINAQRSWNVRGIKCQNKGKKKEQKNPLSTSQNLRWCLETALSKILLCLSRKQFSRTKNKSSCFLLKHLKLQRIEWLRVYTHLFETPKKLRKRNAATTNYNMISQRSQLLLNWDLLSNVSKNTTQTHSQIVGCHKITAPSALLRGKDSQGSHNRTVSGGIITVGRGHYHNIFNYSEPQEAKAVPGWVEESGENCAGLSKRIQWKQSLAFSEWISRRVYHCIKTVPHLRLTYCTDIKASVAFQFGSSFRGRHGFDSQLNFDLYEPPFMLLKTTCQQVNAKRQQMLCCTATHS